MHVLPSCMRATLHAGCGWWLIVHIRAGRQWHGCPAFLQLFSDNVQRYLFVIPTAQLPRQRFCLRPNSNSTAPAACSACVSDHHRCKAQHLAPPVCPLVLMEPSTRNAEPITVHVMSGRGYVWNVEGEGFEAQACATATRFDFALAWWQSTDQQTFTIVMLQLSSICGNSIGWWEQWWAV